MDFIFKIGMVIVALALVAGIMAFVFTSLEKTREENIFHEYNGDNETIFLKIKTLCGECLSKNTDRDCYLVDIDVKQDLNIEEYMLNLPAGKHTIKISDIGGECLVKKV